jgi:hypothetical protein
MFPTQVVQPATMPTPAHISLPTGVTLAARQPTLIAQLKQLNVGIFEMMHSVKNSSCVPHDSRSPGSGKSGGFGGLAGFPEPSSTVIVGDDGFAL